MSKTVATMTKPEPGEICECCERRMPGGRSEPTPEQVAKQKDRQREYNARPEVKERQKAYMAKRREKIREALALAESLQAHEPTDAEA